MLRKLHQAAQEHPVIAALLVTFTVLGAAVGVGQLPEDWSLLHRLTAGGVAGTGIGFLMTATKMLG
jgi:hypothetical protein